ncbi:MAG: VanZ family protein [Nitrospirae bacterium]|nr:VanZ family protein [Nitrospirota bacterium]
MNNKLLLVTVIITLIIIFLVGLWPLSFHPKNEVEWLQNSNGVSFYGRGITYTGSFNLKSSLLHNNPITFEILLEPFRATKSDAGHFLSFYDGKEIEIIAFRQWKSTLEIFRSFPDSRIRLRDALISNEKRLITVSSEKEGTKIYLNGNFAKFYPNFSLIANSEIAAQLILGNSPSGKSPWKGNIFGIAIYNHSLAQDKVFQHYQAWTKGEAALLKKEEPIALYLFDEQKGTSVHNQAGQQNPLLMPSTFQMLQKHILDTPLKDFRIKALHFQDIFINIIGFIPLGFFFSALFNKSKFFSKNSISFITLLLGSLISLSIELIQVYLPTRNSSLTDLICNIFGTFLGIVLFRLIILHSHPRPP